MNKNIRDIIIISFLAFGIFLLPTVINYNYVDKRTERFFERIDENFDVCVKNASEDSRDIRLCKEIKKSSELAFDSAKSVSERFANTTIIETVLFVIAMTLLSFRKRIENLEMK